MTLIIELPDDLDAALKAQAHALGVSEASLVRQLLAAAVEDRREAWVSMSPRLTGADLIEALQSSPFREIVLESLREPLPVRDVSF